MLSSYPLSLHRPPKPTVAYSSKRRLIGYFQKSGFSQGDFYVLIIYFVRYPKYRITNAMTVVILLLNFYLHYNFMLQKTDLIPSLMIT